MVMCFDLSGEAKTAIDVLMRTGQFRNSSEAVSLALVNYEVIQKAVSGGNSIEFPSSQSTPTPGAATSPIPSTEAPQHAQIPDLFRLSQVELNVFNLPEVPAVAPSDWPPTRWMFGQFNKFLPLKASCRALLNLLAKNPAGLPLHEAASRISKNATELGDHLAALDRQMARSREDLFSAAFPKTKSEGSGGVDRFASQFVGDLRQPRQIASEARETKFEGFPAALRFAQCAIGKNPLLTLTRPGMEFALLSNPILDGTETPPNRKFNEEEIQFLLVHIRRCVPEEASAYDSIIDGISEGANNPDELDQYLCNRFRLEIAMRPEDDSQVTQTLLTTQRTGAISRMADLGLLAREKTGMRVRYIITDSGAAFRPNQTSVSSG